MNDPADRETNVDLDQMRAAALDAIHVAVGAGILGFQRAQVERRRWQRVLSRRLAAVRSAQAKPR